MTTSRPELLPDLDETIAQWRDDDLQRAALIFSQFLAEARRCEARCGEWAGADRATWRKPLPREALRARTIARIRARVSRRFLNEALHDWRPSREGH